MAGFVQRVTAIATASSSVTTGSITTSSGNLVNISVIAFDSGTGGGLATADSKTNTWANVQTQFPSSGTSSWACYQAYAKNITGGSGHTFTYDENVGGGYCVIEVDELSGVDTAAPLDKFNKAISSSVSTGTTTQADEIIIYAGMNTLPSAMTLDGALTSTGSQTTAPNGDCLICGYQVVSATGDYSYTTTNAGDSLVTTYKATAVILQYGRPSSDIASNGWTPSTGSDLYAMLDETAADDADYIYSPNNPTTEQFEVRLSLMGDPAGNTGHTIKFHFVSLGFDTTYDMDLVEGTTVLDSWSETVTVAAGAVTRTRPLSTTVADSITDYGNLRIRGVARAP